MVMGAARLATTQADPDGRVRSRRSGVWLIMVGFWGLISEFHLFGFTFATSWPLLVIGAGVLIVWRSLENGRAGRRSVGSRKSWSTPRSPARSAAVGAGRPRSS